MPLTHMRSAFRSKFLVATTSAIFVAMGASATVAQAQETVEPSNITISVLPSPELPGGSLIATPSPQPLGFSAQHRSYGPDGGYEIPVELNALVQERRGELLRNETVNGAVQGAAIGAGVGAGLGAATGALVAGPAGALIGGIGIGFLVGGGGVLISTGLGMAVGCLVGLPAFVVGCIPGAIIGGIVTGAIGGTISAATAAVGGTLIGASTGIGLGAPIGAAIGAPIGAIIGAPIGGALANAQGQEAWAGQNITDLDGLFNWAPDSTPAPVEPINVGPKVGAVTPSEPLIEDITAAAQSWTQDRISEIEGLLT